MGKYSVEDKAFAKEFLLSLAKDGQLLVCVDVVKRGAQGMSRHVKVWATGDIAYPVNVTRHVAALLGWRVSTMGALIIGGCGFSVGDHVARAIGYELGLETMDMDGGY